MALVWLLAFGLAGGTLYGQGKAASTAPPASDYVGTEACKTCHEDIYACWRSMP
jgi:hypothetical protein